LYQKLRPYRTTGYKSHGWVWFYRQLPDRAVDLAREVLTAKPAASTNEVTLRTLASHTSVAPGQEFKVALNFQIADGWHIYGPKKGESYLPTTIEWKLPKGTVTKGVQWPKPLLVSAGESVQPTYEGTITVLVTFISPKDAKVNAPLKLAAKVNWQVCRELLCKRGGAKIETNIAVGASAARESTSAP
jgi:DsbC/DsbD-like thiol-disulfide interchange protein